jgi:hypothetical protein
MPVGDGYQAQTGHRMDDLERNAASHKARANQSYADRFVFSLTSC